MKKYLTINILIKFFHQPSQSKESEQKFPNQANLSNEMSIFQCINISCVLEHAIET